MTSAPLADRIVLTLMAGGRDEEFTEMLDEFRAAGETGVYTGNAAIAWESFAAFYALHERMKEGGYPTPDIVPTDSYFIEEDGKILGEIYIRHSLSAKLEKMGGHIGYKVRPSCRNQGVATAALRLELQKLAAMGVEKALVTCNATNGASARVIEKCGGVRIDDALMEDGRVERRYWVRTGAQSV